MSLLSKLFGSSPKSGPEPEFHGDFRIYPEPKSEQGSYRVGARIEKDFGEETKVHHLVRADTMASVDEAMQFSVLKAKQVIDEQGDRLFG
ncbi:hypothetical protein HKCCE3408_07430 [Rhodobacterales bacterium HKCCE3408]|nr:hypothetical protein [Rhodobacterales bacterium HKCCE3408]